MPVRVFSEEERNEKRELLLQAGIPLLQEYGMTHMSIAKLTQAAGIAKGTFYHFFPSKEAFVMELLRYRRKNLPQMIEQLLKGREKMTMEEAREFAKSIIFSKDSLYPYLTLEDEAKLEKSMPNAMKPDLDHEIQIMCFLFSKIEGVTQTPDYAVIANLMKLIALAAEGKTLLHETGYTRTINLLFDQLFMLLKA